jgi:hypothetical protein
MQFIHKQKTDVQELIENCFSVKESHLSCNIGKDIEFHKPGMAKNGIGMIVGIQRMWGFNENKEYVFGIHGYTVLRTDIDEDLPGAVGLEHIIRFIER